MATMLNLDNVNVVEHEMTVTEARAFIDGGDADEIETWIDEVQAKVHSREHSVAYLVIKIIKD